MFQTIKIQRPDKLKCFFKKRKRFKAAIGGRGSTKSTTIGDGLMALATKGAKIACFREHYSSIKKSVYPLLCHQIEKYKVPGYEIKKTEIEHESGGKFDFTGIARSISDVQSYFGYHFFWLEEAQFIAGEHLRVLTPTLRENNSELWMSANPKNSQDAFSKRFILPFKKQLDKYGYYEDDLHLIVLINYIDNPWFPEVLEQERQFDKEHLSRAMYDHIWNGAFNDSVEDSIIKAEWFDAAINAHEKLGFEPVGIKVLAHDPSDLGTDDKAYAIRHGSVIIDAKTRAFGDVNDGCKWALTEAVSNQVDLFTWDLDGMGTGLKKQVTDFLKGKRVKIKPFSGAKGPEHPNQIYEYVESLDKKLQKTNKILFKNRRAQFYYKLKDRLFNTYLAVEKKRYIDPDKLLSFSPDIEDLRLLRSEICRIPRQYNDQGTIQIMSKPNMKKLKIESPNLSDSVMMSLSSTDPVDNFTPLKFDSFFN